MRFINVRDDLATTIFVPWDCANNCKFCTSKAEYSQYKLDFDKVALAIMILNKTKVRSFVFTGGEPFANLTKLKELISLIDSDKTVYLNTTLPNTKNIDDVIEYINTENKIKGISISRHSDSYDWEKLNNIAPDEKLKEITKNKRINCVLADKFNLSKIINRWDGTPNTMLNLRGDFRNISQETLKSHDDVTNYFLNNNNYYFTYEGGCNVCYNITFVKVDTGFVIQYHKGFFKSSFKINENTIVYNDIVVKPNGNIYYDWDNENENIDQLLNSIK
jgi:organic radical activating enzyme